MTRRCLRRGLLVPLIVLAVLGVAGAAPAGAQEDADELRAGEPPVPGDLECEAVFDGNTPQHWDCTAPYEILTMCTFVDSADPERPVDDRADADLLRCSDRAIPAQFECDVGDGSGDIPDGVIRCPLESGWTGVGNEPVTPEGTFRIECRNEIELGIHPSGWGPSWLSWLPRPRWGDDHREVVVPYAVPDWWIDEVEKESQDMRAGFEGRGETEEWSEDTKNLGGRGCDLAESPPAPLGMQTCVEINAAKAELRRRIDDDEADTGDRALLDMLENQGSIVPDDCWGTYPTSRYSVTWNPRSHWTGGGWSDRLTSWLSMLLFGILQQGMLLALWITRVAFEFDIGEYRDTLAHMAGNIDRELVHVGGRDEISLMTMAWFTLVAVAGFLALRGKLARAGAEILTALILAVVFTVMLGPMLEPLPEDLEEVPAYAPEGYMTSFTNVVDQSSRAPLLVANGLSPDQEVDRSRMEELLRSTHGTLHREFIEDPALYINFGRAEFSQDNPRGEGPGCAEIVDNILTVQNPPRTWPSNYLARYQCVDEASFNSDMSPARLGSVALITLVGLVTAAVVGLSGITLLVTKFLVTLLFVILPVAAVSAVLPAAGRKVATWWLGALVQLWLASMAMGGVLMLVLFSIHATAVATETVGLSLTERWVSLLVVMLTVAVLRKRLAAASQRVAGRVQGTLERLGRGGEGPGPLWRTPAGGTRPAGAPAAGGAAEPGAVPTGTGVIAGVSSAEAAAGARVVRSVGLLAMAAPEATRAAMLGADAPQTQTKGGFDLGGVSKFASNAGYAGLGAAMVGGSLAAGAAGMAVRLATAPGRGAAALWQTEYGRRRSARLNQSYRAQLSETELLRTRRLNDALATKDDLIQRGRRIGLPKGQAAPRFYDPAYPRYRIRLQTPSMGHLHTEREIGRLHLWNLRAGPAFRDMRRGQVVAPGGDVRYQVRYRPNLFFLPRMPSRLRTSDGTWVKVKPSRPLRNPLWQPWRRTVKRDGMPPMSRMRDKLSNQDVPSHLRPRWGPHHFKPRWGRGGPTDPTWKDH